MARSLFRALIHESHLSRSPLLSPSSRLLAHRGRSDRPDPDPAPSPSPPSPDSEADLGFRRLEEAIQSIIIRRSAPDWLPFIPGSSYWIPPRNPPISLTHLHRASSPLSQEEKLSLTTVRGWPSSSFFEKGAPPHKLKNSQVKVSTQSDDEEG